MIRSSIAVRCLLLATLGCGGSPIEPPSVDASLYPGVRKEIERVRESVRRSPRSASAWGHLAMLLDAHDLETDARACYRRAADLDPDDPRWPYLVADALETEDPEEADRWLTRAARIEGPHPTASLRLAEHRLSNGDARDSLADLEVLRRKMPNEPRLRMLMATCLDACGRTEEALVHAAAAAGSAPSHRGIRELIARLLYRLGRHSEAADAIQAAERLPVESRGWPDPWREQVSALRRDPHHMSDEALALAKTGDPDACDSMLESLVRDHPDDWTFAAELARFRIRRGDAAGAESAANVAQHPAAKELWKLRGAARLLSGDWDGAAADLRGAVSLDAADAAAWSDLAYAYEQLLDLDSAIACLERAMMLEPLDTQNVRRLERLLAAQSASADGTEDPK